MHPFRFFREFCRNIYDIGSVWPSSRFLARKMAASLAKKSGRVDVLEVGAGTGAFTRAIVPHIQPGDTLDLVEVNAAFVETLRKRLETDERFKRVKDQTRVIHARLEEMEGDQRYDHIICGLPMNNFPPEVVRTVWEVMIKRLKPGGILSNVEYMIFPHLSRLLSWGKMRRRLKEVRGIVDGYYRGANLVGRYVTFLNIPPAFSRHFRFSEPAAAPASGQGDAALPQGGGQGPADGSAVGG